MPRPQFTLRALLVAMLVVAAFFGGMVGGQSLERRKLKDERQRLQSCVDTLEVLRKSLLSDYGERFREIDDYLDFKSWRDSTADDPKD